MPRLHYAKPNALSQLHDEILAAVPALRPTAEGPVMLVEGLGEDIWLTVPDDADRAAVDRVVAAHVPRPPAPDEPTLFDQVAAELDTLQTLAAAPGRLNAAQLDAGLKAAAKALDATVKRLGEGR